MHPLLALGTTARITIDFADGFRWPRTGNTLRSQRVDDGRKGRIASLAGFAFRIEAVELLFKAVDRALPEYEQAA